MPEQKQVNNIFFRHYLTNISNRPDFQGLGVNIVVMVFKWFPFNNRRLENKQRTNQQVIRNDQTLPLFCFLNLLTVLMVATYNFQCSKHRQQLFLKSSFTTCSKNSIFRRLYVHKKKTECCAG